MPKPKYGVYVPKDKNDGGTFWHRIGAGWDAQSGNGISLELMSLPTPNRDGKVVINVFEFKEDFEKARQERDHQEKDAMGLGRPQPAAFDTDLDDDVPF